MTPENVNKQDVFVKHDASAEVTGWSRLISSHKVCPKELACLIWAQDLTQIESYKPVQVCKAIQHTSFYWKAQNVRNTTMIYFRNYLKAKTTCEVN